MPTLGAEKTYTWTTRSGFNSLKATWLGSGSGFGIRGRVRVGVRVRVEV